MVQLQQDRVILTQSDDIVLKCNCNIGSGEKFTVCLIHTYY